MKLESLARVRPSLVPMQGSGLEPKSRGKPLERDKISPGDFNVHSGPRTTGTKMVATEPRESGQT